MNWSTTSPMQSPKTTEPLSPESIRASLEKQLQHRVRIVLTDEQAKFLVSHLEYEIMYKPNVNLRLQKQMIINVLREHMSVRGYTALELSRFTEMNLDNVRKYLRDMQLGDCHAYVSQWVKGRDGKWKGLWMFGNKPSVPRPPKCAATIERQKKRERRAARINAEIREQEAAAERRRHAARRTRKEEQDRAALLAQIVPHRDPWAHLMHGGAAVLSGVQA